MLKRFDNIGIAVSNLDEALKFYVDQLGLVCNGQYDGPPRGAAVSPSKDGSYLFLFETKNKALRADVRTSAMADNPLGVDHISFLVENLEQTFAGIRDRGAPVIAEPHIDPTWNLKMAGFRDPSGNVVYLIEWA